MFALVKHSWTDERALARRADDTRRNPRFASCSDASSPNECEQKQTSGTGDADGDHSDADLQWAVPQATVPPGGAGMTAALALDLDLPTRVMPPPASQPRATAGQLLAALPSAVGRAQRFVRFTLERWRLFGLIDSAETVVAELVTDAVAATGIAVEHPGYLDLYEKQVNLLDLRVVRWRPQRRAEIPRRLVRYCGAR